MSFRSQTGSRKNSGEKFQKSNHEKAKGKERKSKSGKTQLQEEALVLSLKDVEAKTVDSLNRLGNQTFALSPFSQYFDDWLVSLKQVVSEFESNPNANADDLFVKERSQIFIDVERSLAENRLQESKLSEVSKALAENNHQLADLDAENAAKNREIDRKRKLDIQILTHKIHDLENESATQKEKATKGFNPFAKRSAAQKLILINQDLKAAKNELEVTLQNFTVEQEKIHDDYEKSKQEVTAKVESLQREIEELETDKSLSARQAACNAFVCAIKALIQRIQPKTDDQPAGTI